MNDERGDCGQREVDERCCSPAVPLTIQQQGGPRSMASQAGRTAPGLAREQGPWPGEGSEEQRKACGSESQLKDVEESHDFF